MITFLWVLSKMLGKNIFKIRLQFFSRFGASIGLMFAKPGLTHDINNVIFPAPNTSTIFEDVNLLLKIIQPYDGQEMW